MKVQLSYFLFYQHLTMFMKKINFYKDSSLLLLFLGRVVVGGEGGGGVVHEKVTITAYKGP